MLAMRGSGLTGEAKGGEYRVPYQRRAVSFLLNHGLNWRFDGKVLNQYCVSPYTKDKALGLLKRR